MGKASRKRDPGKARASAVRVPWWQRKIMRVVLGYLGKPTSGLRPGEKPEGHGSWKPGGKSFREEEINWRKKPVSHASEGLRCFLATRRWLWQPIFWLVGDSVPKRSFSRENKSRKRKRRLWKQYNLSEKRLWSPVLKWRRRLQVKAWALCLCRVEESWATVCTVVVTAVSRTIFSEIQEAKSESFSSSLRGDEKRF